ncbi:DUF4184 family protein [Sinosporangium siamense]|uniref:DUF4184 family protein n=1 Tax=Sinosporangium siamense TaxID=1367973 RepID=A0A919RD38_9ACTN|nr:DUF4184 family protein [Sinosporangium siamense]GII91492.1 hypothetical protein Ssi02_17230 [Sinosporangium siamense]
MPFTPSHIAAVVPLMASARLRRVVDPWALAVGAMVPDIPIFLPFLPEYGDWHSLPGILTLDLFSALVLLFVFHTLLRDPLIALLPPGLAARAATVASGGEYGWRRLPAVVLGAVVGSATHVFWDSFTHSYSAGVWGLAFLAEPLAGRLTVFRLLQYTSTVAGGAVVVWWALRGLGRVDPRPLPARLGLPGPVRVTVLAGVAASSVAGLFLWPLVDPPDPVYGWPGMLTKVGAGTVVGAALALLAYAVTWRVTRLLVAPSESG